MNTNLLIGGTRFKIVDFSELFGIVSEFVLLSAGPRVRGERRRRAIELMAELRRWDFTSIEISELSGGAWSETSVRVYTPEWGVVDEQKKLVKENMMNLLRETVLANRVIGDLEWMRALDVSAKSKGSSVEQLAELDSLLEPLGIKRGEIGILVAASRSMAENETTPEALVAQMDVDAELEKRELTKPVRGILLE
jgi:hypothetical protein